MRNYFQILLFIFTLIVNAQDNKLWRGYFSYNSIKDISSNNSALYVAAENAYFTRNITTNETTTVSTLEGLSGGLITQIYHSQKFNKTIIGHEDGLLIVVNNDDGSMFNLVDILNKPSIAPNKKRINHFNEFGDKIYISTDFGICVYDLKTNLFGDTYFIGPSGSNIEILQTTIFNNSIYAIANGYGLLSATLSNPFLIDYNQWSMISGGSWMGVQATATNLVAISMSGTMYDVNGMSLSTITSFPQLPKDVRYSGNNLIVTSQNFVYLFQDNLSPIVVINNTSNPAYNFTCAIKGGNKIYIGTLEHGLITASSSGIIDFSNLSPSGPLKNRVFGMATYSEGIWTCFGDYTISYNPFPLDAFGVSKYSQKEGWKTIPYSDLFNAKSIAKIIVDPNNENKVYFSSYHSGVLQFENDVPTNIYNATNSSLQNILPTTLIENVRVNGSASDQDGNIWFTNSLVTNNIHVLRTNGQWQEYPISVIGAPTATNLNQLAIDKNGTKWLATNRFGLVGFNEKMNKSLAINDDPSAGNLPSISVRSVAIDKKNKVWIGTIQGLRILQNADSFLTQSSLSSNSIIILEDELAQELLYQQFITDIVVDGSNNKWIATADSGVFYISDDGQKTIYHFTKENSPLPSNAINDVDINKKTGEVFFATENGLVSFRSNVTDGNENFENVIAFPNPVRPEYNGNVIITGLMDKANVKITDIEGNLVFEKISEGGTVEWDTKVFGKKKVASGVYMVLLSSDDGLLTKVKKVMIVR